MVDVTREEGRKADLERSSRFTSANPDIGTLELLGVTDTPESPSEDSVPLMTESLAQTIPLASEVPTIQDETTVEPWDNQLRNEAAIIRDGVDSLNIDPVRAFQNGLRGHPLAELKGATGDHVNDRKDTIKQMVREQLPPDPNESIEVLSLTQNLLDQEERKIINEHLAYFDTLDKDENVEGRELQAVLRYMDDLTVRAVSQMGLGDKILEIGEFFVPGNIIADNIAVSGSVDTKDFMTRVMNGIDQLPLEERLPAMAIFFNKVLEDTDNPFKAIDLLKQVVDPTQSIGNRVDTVLDVIDVALLGTAGVLTAGKIVRKVNMIQDLANSGRRTEGGVLNANGVASSEVAQSTGIDRVTAMSNAAGIRLGGNLDPAYASGLSQDSLRNINRFREDAAKTTGDIVSEAGVRREGAVSGAARADQEAARFAEISELEGIENVEMIDRTAATTTFKYDMRMPDGRVIPSQQEWTLQVDKLDEYELGEVTLGKLVLASPTVIFKKGEFLGEVQSAQRIEQAAARINNQLRTLQNQALRSITGTLGIKRATGLANKSVQRVQNVLDVGDETSQVYTASQLRAGVNGVRLSDKEIEAYYNTRAVIDASYVLRNFEARQTLEAQGARGVWLRSDIMDTAKVMDDHQSAAASLSGKAVLFDTRTNRSVRVADLELDELYARNLRVVRGIGPMETEAGTFSHALIKTTDIRELPLQVINYKKGYVPKIDTRSRYFVKTFAPTTMDGVTIAADDLRASSVTLRKFETEAEATAWSATPEARGLAEPGEVIRVLEDREAEKIIRAMSFGSQGNRPAKTGGLYNGHRAEEDIPFGPDGVRGPRLGAYEALSHNLSNVANTVSWNLWRTGVQERLLKTAQKLGFSVTKLDDIRGLPDGTKEVAALKASVAQLDDWNRVPTKAEQFFQDTARNLYEKLAPNLPEGVKDVLVKANFASPAAAAKTAAFNLYLGFMNIAQLPLQASGAAVALSRNLFRPAELGKVLNQQNALMIFTHSPENLRGAAKAVSGMGDKFDEMADLYNRSGLKDSLLTTADHGAAIAGSTLSTGAVRTLVNAGRLPYNVGEGFNRRTAFVTAYRSWKEANPTKVLGREEEVQILTRANQLLLELGRANRAEWQKGIVGVPTQFMQIITKSVETLLGMNTTFKTADRSKMLMAQMALYGAAGVPLAGATVQYMADKIGWTDADLEDPANKETIKALNEGLVGWSTLQLFGVDADISQRFALVGNITGMLDSLISDDKGLVQALSGAAGGRANTVWELIDREIAPLSLDIESVDDLEITQSFLTVAKVISSFNNAHKAYIMSNYHQIRDGRGRVKIQRDFDTAEEVAQAIGFRISEEAKLDSLANVQRIQKEVEGKYVEELIRLTQVYAQRSMDKTLDDEQIESFKRKRDALVATLPMAQRQRVMDAYHEALKNKRTKAGKVYNTYLQNKSNEIADRLYNLQSILSSRGLEVPTKPEE